MTSSFQAMVTRIRDIGGGEGARVWSHVQLALPRRMPMEHAVAEHRYGKPIVVQPRLGQGAFRLLVTDAYQRRHRRAPARRLACY